MAFDGACVAALAAELENKICGGRIAKIAQPEKDELMLTIKAERSQYRLLISVNPSLPVMYLTDESRTAPLSAPAFCMFLRKHIQGGKITRIFQPSLERIINFEIEHYNEMGDLCTKVLTIEMMGKHSNIIFRDDTKILDSIRHVSSLVSSVREVLPGREYFIPFSSEKLNPFAVEKYAFIARVTSGSNDLAKSIYSSVTGFSPDIAEEICFKAGIDSSKPAGSLNDDEKNKLFESFLGIVSMLKNRDFSPVIYYKASEPVAFSSFRLDIYQDHSFEEYDSISALLKDFYSKKQKYTTIRQKTTDLRHIVQTTLNKDYKKLDLQLKQIKDTEKKDKFKVYGELLTAYGYGIEPKSTSYKTTDFYTGDEVTIPLDPDLSAIENAKKYFEKYSKLKRTGEALEQVTEETKSEIEHLESIVASLNTAANEADIDDIKSEMAEAGYIKKTVQRKKGFGKAVKSEPLHFVSSDGFDIYVGKNNYQNEFITFKLAEGGDWWFHAKNIPGSHVVLKCSGREVPDSSFEDAAALAAHFSKAGDADKVEIDYIQRKHVKKPGGGKPGFVIYHTNYSMTASTDISHITQK